MKMGQPAAKVENTKRTKYRNLVRRFRFKPIAIETSGVFGPTTRNIVHEIGKRISEKKQRMKERLHG